MPQSRRSAARSRHRHAPRPPLTTRQHPAADDPAGAAGSGAHPVAPPTTTGWTLLPLRAFLGITFCFAGLQKLANPTFFHASSPASIQAQLAGAARRSPIHALLGPLQHVAVPLGLLIAFAELAVGLGTLVGLFSRVAAAGGILISFSLFLTVSFHSNPYFTGSDIVFVFAWTPLLLAGAGPLSLDTTLADLARQGRLGAGQPPFGYAGRGATEIDRRVFVARTLVGAVLAGVGLIGGGLVAAIGRLVGGTSSAAPATSLSAGTGGAAAGSSGPTTTTTAAPTSTTGAGATHPASSPSTTAAPTSRPPGTRLGPASAVPVGGAASFTDPASGDPALVVQPQRGTFLAFDAVCPHAGCPVQYSSQDHLFICPCHGSEFNGRTGAVQVGPAQSGLQPIAIAEGSDGQLYAK